VRVTADVIKFPKQKARPAPTAFDLMVAHACAVASGEALIALASDCASARERGEPSPIMAPVIAIADLFQG
jgi:hypothetical protein